MKFQDYLTSRLIDAVGTDIRFGGKDAVEDKLITVALSRTQGNRTIAANILGMHVRTLHRKIAKRIKEDGQPLPV